MSDPNYSPSDNNSQPNSTTSARVPASSLNGSETTSTAQQNNDPSVGDTPDASDLSRVVSSSPGV